MALPSLLIEKLVTDTIFHHLREYVVNEGYLPDIKLIPNYDSNNPSLVRAASELYLDQCQQIKGDKGFCIEVLSFSSNQYKEEKKAPRIIVDIHQMLPGDLGNDVSIFYESTLINPAVPSEGIRYIRKRNSPMLSNLTFAVYAVGSNSLHLQIMNHFIMSALPYKGYMKPLGSENLLPYNNFFVDLKDKGKGNDLAEGIMERYYIYDIPDLLEVPEIIIPGNVAAIESIILDPYTL